MDGILSFWELSQPLVSRLAERLGVPANAPAAVDAAREKQVHAPLLALPLALHAHASQLALELMPRQALHAPCRRAYANVPSGPFPPLE